MKHAEHTANPTSTPKTRVFAARTGIFATRGGLLGSKGTGAPSSRHLRATLAILALAIAAFALTAAPASAAPLAAKMETISNVSYTSAHVTGKLSSPCSGFCSTSYAFQYATSESGPWSPGPGGSFEGFAFPAFENKLVEGDFEEAQGIKGGTKYFVRLVASFEGEVIDPAAPPYPSFTTLTVDPPIILATDDASGVFSTSAKATGKVKRPANDNSAFDVSACRFEYVSDDDFKVNGFTGAAVSICDQATPFTTPEGETDATAQLGCPNPLLPDPEGKCLKPGTTYHLRLAAENAAPDPATKEATNTFTTLAPVVQPTVTATDDASEIGSNSAKFTGKVQRPAGDDPALNVTCHFEYITDAQFVANEGVTEPPFTGASSVDCAENPITAAKVDAGGEIGVSANPGLLPETTYHFRLLAENAGGTDIKDAANTFTTPEADKPVVTIDPVVGGTYTTAHVSGTASYPHGLGAAFSEISTDGENWSRGTQVAASRSGQTVIEDNYTGLQPSTTYFFRFSAYYERGYSPDEAAARGEVAFSAEPSITTEPLAPPTAENLAVTDITGTSAHFSATVDPHAPAGPLSPLGKKAFATHWEFVCTPECKNANGNVIEGTVQGEEGAQTVTGDVKRLEPNTPYEVSLIVHSEGGDDTETIPFSTKKLPPTVKQTPGAPDGKAGYNLQGVVNPNNQTVTSCEFKWGPDAPIYAFKADCSPLSIGGSKPITVEAHLSGLNIGVDYHSLLVVKYGADIEIDSGVDQKFKATLDPPENCPGNEQLRKENSSLALPECRAYEMVTPPGKEGFHAQLLAYDGGARVRYVTKAGNIARSGQGIVVENLYVAARSATGWETIPNLNGSSGSIYDAPTNFVADGIYSGLLGYSSDFLSSVWFNIKSDSAVYDYYLRGPDGKFTLLAKGEENSVGKFQIGGTSDDLSHLFITSNISSGFPTFYGPGVYEFLGTGNEQPTRRVDVDNSDSPITTCTWNAGSSAQLEFNSRDGRVAVSRVAGGCGGANPPATGLWARIDGTTSIDIAASECERTAADPGGACNDPVGSGGCTTALAGEAGPGCRGLQFQGAASDGSRIFFTTSQQLLDADTDETTDLYACDIPSGTPAPVGDANPCSALRQVSAGDPAGADVESVGTTSANGATVLFTAKGVLADNEDALKEQAVAGDHNLYAWRQDSAHPAGETTFVGRLSSVDLSPRAIARPQATPDGRYLVFTTASQLLDTDTDNARDVYRYDADTGQLIRASTNVFGVAGNGDGFDVCSGVLDFCDVSDDGQKIVFTTAEALSPADGNAESDVYLWTPERVSLISTGAVGAGGSNPRITASGQDIYFDTPGALTPADGDNLIDVYDARIGGGFSFAPAAVCSGEACQPGASNPPTPEPLGSQSTSSGNPPLPKPCPKGKVRNKKGKCVKKHTKGQEHKKKGKGNAHRAGHNRGGSK